MCFYILDSSLSNLYVNVLYSTNIEIQCTSGGLGLLSVTDDGKGIHPDDFQLAVTRFATSKLSSFEDLKSIQTFGFRGEALASTSMVSRMTIISKCRPTSHYGIIPSSTTTATTTKNDNGTTNIQSNNNLREVHCAYKQCFIDGKPTSSKPTPIAGNFGTLIKVEDLFYNIPSRRRAFDGSRKESEEYQKILLVTQRYAIHKARDGIGFICKKQAGVCDLNTANMASIKKIQEDKKKLLKSDGSGGEDWTNTEQIDLNKASTITATKDAISHIFGPQLVRELLYLECSEGDIECVTRAALLRMKTGDDKKVESSKPFLIAKTPFDDINHPSEGLLEMIQMDPNDDGKQLASASSSDMDSNRFAYRAFGFISNGTYCVPKASSAFILFINDRLVESAYLRRAMENIYTLSLPKGAKPFLYLSLYLPGPHVDVNVHPTKREVAFLHMDLLCESLVSATRKVLFSSTRHFRTEALVKDTKKTNPEQESLGENSSHSKTVSFTSQTHELRQQVLHTDPTTPTTATLPKKESSSIDRTFLEGNLTESKSRLATDHVGTLRNGEDVTGNSKKSKLSSSAGLNLAPKPYDPKNLVRIVQQQGAIEPYLTDAPKKDSNGGNETSSNALEESISDAQHLPFCEFSDILKTIDLSIPGAFASICRCQITRHESKVRRNASEFTLKPKKIPPTNCNLASIRKLRSDVTDSVNNLWTNKVREAIFVGCVSKHRSLWQWGVELLLVHHSNLARELFYQLTLARFSGAVVGLLDDGGVNVQALVESALQFEEDCARDELLDHGDKFFTSISETNKNLASQVTQCLADKGTTLNGHIICLLMTCQRSATLRL